MRRQQTIVSHIPDRDKYDVLYSTAHSTHVLVLLVQTQKGPSHDNEFDLVHRVSDRAQLLHPPPHLRVGIVAGANRPHARGLVARVGLRGVLKVGIGSAGTVHADVARVGNVRTPVRFAHDGHHCDSRSRPHGFGLQVGPQFGAVRNREALQYVAHFGNPAQFVLFGSVAFEFGEIEGGSFIVGADQFLDNVGDGERVARLVGGLGRHGGGVVCGSKKMQK